MLCPNLQFTGWTICVRTGWSTETSSQVTLWGRWGRTDAQSTNSQTSALLGNWRMTRSLCRSMARRSTWWDFKDIKEIILTFDLKNKTGVVNMIWIPVTWPPSHNCMWTGFWIFVNVAPTRMNLISTSCIGYLKIKF